MVRITSLSYAPAETRRLLRSRLGRFLPTEQWRPVHSRQQTSLDDESILKLLLGLHIDFQNDEQNARAAYEASRERYPGAPPFDDLVHSGWVRIVFGRVRSALGTDHALRRANDDARMALGPVLARGDQQFTVAGLGDV